MKKALVSILIFFSTFSLYSQSKDFSNWSIYGEYGYNYLDGDINQNISSVFPTSFREITYGGGIEYGFSPTWGISLEYFYFPLKAENSVPQKVFINTDLHSGSVNATINFTRLIFPETKSKLHLNGSIGLGFAYYEYSPVDEAGNEPTNILRDNDGLAIGKAGTVPVTFSTEYNFSKPLSLGLKVHYRAYTKDNLEGITNLNWKGVTNDFIAAGSVFLRYKIGSYRKDHVRNIRWQEFAPDLGLTTALEAKAEIAALKNKVDDIDKKVDGVDKKVDDLSKRVDSIMPKIENIELFIANTGVDTDGDGVPDIRDQEPNTEANTAVDFWGRKMKIPVSTTNINQDTEIPAIYFDFDSYKLDELAIITISKIGLKMLADTTLMVEIVGSTDFAGGVPYNYELSKRRAEAVKKSLIKVWELSPNRIITSWKGRIESPSHRYRLNRRCDIIFSK
jgi:outer membrane protein OmpA-like peptidoglycan-associated protein